MNVKLNDNVVVLVGKDKNKQGKVIAVSPKTNKVTVEGVNIQHKHKKARSAQDTSRIIDQEGGIDVSNVMVVCDACGKPTRVKHSVIEGKSVRICAKCGAALDKAYVKAVKAAATETQAPAKRVRKRTAKAAENAEAATQDTAEEKKD